MVHFLCNFLDTEKAYKIDNQFLVGFIQRRERDSNPRTREDQQFSRLPHSTTLPSLQYESQDGICDACHISPFVLGLQRYELIRYLQIIFQFYSKNPSLRSGKGPLPRTLKKNQADFSSEEKNFHWKSIKYIAPQVTQLSAKLNTAPKNVRGYSIQGSL